MKRSSAVNVAVGGLISAFSLVILLISGIFPYGTYALPLAAGVLLIPIFLEFGVKWSFLVYLSVSLLSLITVADKEAVVLYILLFGYYPFLKAYIERLKNKFLKYLLKLIVFNISAVSAYYIMLFVFNMSSEEFRLFGVDLPLVFLAVGNLIFLVYDRCLSICVALYFKKYRAVLWRK